MTWAKTKVDQDDPDAFLAEDEYRRRKPHPNFKNHIAVEKNIIKAGKKSALHTYIVAPGLIYHSGDSIFHHLFKAVSECLSTGKVKRVPKEIALVNRDLPQLDYDMLMVNLRLEPGHSGMVENMPQLVQEYKDARGLHPLKLIIHGPPAVGKTLIAAKLAQHYEIHAVEVEAVVKDALERLQSRIHEATTSEDTEEDVDALREFLEEVQETAKANNGKVAEHHVIGFVKEKLRSMPCRNQGYILDGYPTNNQEASSLFRGNHVVFANAYTVGSGDEEAKDDRGASEDVILPDFVISMEASDEFIKERIMNIPEAALEVKNTEEALVRRLEEFRSGNTEENTVLNFFDELEIHPLLISVETKSLDSILDYIIKHLGPPRNYGPSVEQIAEKKRQEEERKAKETAAAEEERIRREKEEAERQSKAIAEWNARMEDIKRQEQEVLEAQSVPLRNYLMKFVMPTLTSALIEVCKIRPEVGYKN
ncbi:Adenylate kinase 7 [Phlyctochytrium bullatum]|nr:Adenylate kinase 7 [Phlyctochytrium bullatum]